MSFLVQDFLEPVACRRKLFGTGGGGEQDEEEDKDGDDTPRVSHDRVMFQSGAIYRKCLYTCAHGWVVVSCVRVIVMDVARCVGGDKR